MVDPSDVRAEPGAGSSEAVVRWTSPGGASGTVVAYSPTEPPSDCDSGRVLESVTSPLSIFGIAPGSNVYVRVCGVFGNERSPGVAAETQLPALPAPGSCQKTLSGGLDVGTVQAALNPVFAAGPNVTCLAEGAVVSGSGSLSIPSNGALVGLGNGATLNGDLTVSVSEASDVQIAGLRLFPGSGASIVVSNASNVQIQDVELEMTRPNTSGMLIAGSQITALSEVTIRMRAGGSAGIDLLDSTVDWMSDVLVKSYGPEVAALSLVKSSVSTIADSTFVTSHAGTRGITLSDDSRISAMQRVRIARHGLTLPMEEVALAFDDRTPVSGIDSRFVRDVEICSLHARTSWLEPLANLTTGGVAVPDRFTPFQGTHLGAASFPFDDETGSWGTDRGVQLGGLCTVDVDAIVRGGTTITVSNFQPLLDAAIATGDLDRDGLIALEVEDGTALQSEGVSLRITRDDVYLMVGAGGLVTIEETVSSSTPSPALAVVGARDVSLFAINIRTNGGPGVSLQDATAPILRNLFAESAGTQNNGIEMLSSFVGVIDASSATTSGVDAEALFIERSEVALVTGGAFSTVANESEVLVVGDNRLELLENTQLTSLGDDAQGIELLPAGSLGEIRSCSIRTRGDRASAVVLGEGSWIDAISGLELTRTSGSGGEAVGFVFRPESYVKTLSLRDVFACFSGGGAPWTGIAADGEDDLPGAWVFPSSTIPFDGSIEGAVTFPAFPPYSTDQSIVLGDSCPAL